MKAKINKKEEDGNFISEFFKMFDFYKNLPDNLREPTLTGATFSLGLIGMIVFLIISKTYEFRHQQHSEIMIDFNPDDKLPINLDITFPFCPCYPLSLDIIDKTGVHIVDIEG